jgi:hypothetical protein
MSNREFPLLTFGPTDRIHLAAAERNCQSGLQCKVLPRATEGALVPLARTPPFPINRRMH